MLGCSANPTPFISFTAYVGNACFSPQTTMTLSYYTILWLNQVAAILESLPFVRTAAGVI